MKLKIIILSVVIFSNIFSQKLEQPKLVVGIVVDQMRFEDLYRYYNFFDNDGFKKLLNYGANFTYAHFNYEPTTTAPGHASIFTGSFPYFHGIVANDFFDNKTKKMINAVKDENYLSVGSDDEVGRCSPKRLLASTITDQIKLFNNFQSKVITISLKDRGAVLPGGQLADAAYWYNYKTGDFISSSYYLKTLPDWLVNFNNRNLPQNYMQKGWSLLLEQEAYSSLNDLSQRNTTKVFKEDQIKFPYDFKNLSNEELNNAFQFTPYANQILVDLAKEIIRNENIGKDNIPDFISISFSATDIIGHTWGNFSPELMDTYIRLDRTIADLISFLNNEVGEKNYLLFLTSDHGAVETPSVMKNFNAITGELNTKTFYDSLKSFAANNFGSEKIILNFSNRQIYLDRNYIKENNLEFDDVEESFVNYLRDNFNSIQTIMTRTSLEKVVASRIPQSTLLNGWNPSLSGDIIFNLKPGFLNNFMQSGTTHSSAYSYDTHVPLIFYGWKIPAKEINNLVYVTDIAATIANLLKINPPNACIGIPLSIYWD